MAGRIHCIKNLSRHRSLAASITKPASPGKCVFTTTGIHHRLNTQLLSSARCVQSSASSCHSSSVFINRLLRTGNRNRVKLAALGVLSGLGVGFLASSTQGAKWFTSALAAEPTDPTTTESGWLPATEEIYAKLLARVDAGELKLLRTTKEPLGRVVFTLSHPQKGAHFEYALFFEEAMQKGISVIQFGPQTQGPPGFVHGGATATMFDTVTGVFTHSGLKKRCLTANLNINYRRPIPLNSTVMAETWVEKIEGRKMFVRCEMKSTDGQVLIEGTALWIVVKKS